MSSFRRLFQISCSHDYFGGPFQQFQIKPTPQTARLLSNLRLVANRNRNNFSVHTSSDSLSERWRDGFLQLLNRSTLAWSFAPTGEDFANYTIFPASPNGKIYCFSNLNGGGRLTVGNSVSGKDQIDLRPTRFTFSGSKPLSPRSPVVVCDASGDELCSMAVLDAQAVQVDVSPWGGGLYSLRQKGGAAYYFYADDGLNWSDAFGVVLIDGRRLAVDAGFDNGAAQNKQVLYTLAFGARSVVWRYNFFNTRPEDEQDLGIRNGRGKGGADFRRVAGVESPDSSVSVSFESARPIPMRYRPPARFALYRQGAVIVDPLPLPSAGVGRSSDGKAMCSDIFFYL